jgi:epoxyqueuosine reductase
MESLKHKYAGIIKKRAAELGFQYCGISKADFLEEEAPGLEKFLARQHHGKMGWLENHFDKRLDPRKLVEGAQSVISLLLNYYPEQELKLNQYKISRYAYGQDYHHIIKEKLKELVGFIEEEIGEVNGRIFVDSAPVMDKAWAKKSGLGWAGKNTNLINPKSGSYFFIAEIISDLSLPDDGPIKDYCGTCTRCLDACPTDALYEPYKIDASRCISYLTIELKEQIPSEFRGKMEQWIFGCDICQEVCPWNRFSKPHSEPLLNADNRLQELEDSDLKEITSEVFSDLFRKSAIKRTKYEGLKRNIDFVSDPSQENT